MITTAAADTLAGLFAGAPATGGSAIASGVAFGQVLSASADMPAAPMTPLISRTMPGIATLPIGTLMGTGSLPFRASNLPSALAWSGASVTADGTMPSASQPMTILPASVASMPITSSPLSAAVTDGSLTATPPAIEPAGQPMPGIDGPSLPVAKDTPKAAVPVTTAPVVEAPLPKIVTLDLSASASAPAEDEIATPMSMTDGRKAPPPPASVAKVERPTIAPVRLAESAVIPTPDTFKVSFAEPEPAAPNELAGPARGQGSVRRAEAKEKAPETFVSISVDPLAMPSPAPVLAAMPSMPSDKPVITLDGKDPVSSDDDRFDSVNQNPLEEATSPGVIPLPSEMVVAPIKTIGMASGQPTAAAAPSVHPAVVPPPQTDAASLATIDTSNTATPHLARSTPHMENAVREEGRLSDTGAIKTQPTSFANLVTHTEATAKPAPTAAAPAPPPEPRVAAQPGRMGQEMGVAIARHAATGGGEAMTVRLDPVEFGRIEVTLSFDDSGTIRAMVAAESPAALDLLRRDSADLGRSLAEAGIRSDAQSFRFDTRQGSADGSGQGGQRWQQQSAAGTRTVAQATDDNPEPVYRPLRTQGRVDLMA